MLSFESQESDLASNDHNLPTPLTASELSADRSLGPSPCDQNHSQIVPANIAERQAPRLLLPSQPLDDKKRQMPSTPLLLAPSPKRQRMLRSKASTLPQDNASTEARCPSKKKEPQLSIPLTDVSVASLPQNGLTSSEKMTDHNNIGLHQFEAAADLTINNTHVAKSPAAAVVSPRRKKKPTTRGKSRRHTDCIVTTHDDDSLLLRNELLKLNLQLSAAIQRARDQLSAHEAQTEAYWTHFSRFESERSRELELMMDVQRRRRRQECCALNARYVESLQGGMEMEMEMDRDGEGEGRME